MMGWFLKFKKKYLHLKKRAWKRYCRVSLLGCLSSVSNHVVPGCIAFVLPSPLLYLYLSKERFYYGWSEREDSLSFFVPILPPKPSTAEASALREYTQLPLTLHLPQFWDQNWIKNKKQIWKIVSGRPASLISLWLCWILCLLSSHGCITRWAKPQRGPAEGKPRMLQVLPSLWNSLSVLVPQISAEHRCENKEHFMVSDEGKAELLVLRPGLKLM